MGDEGDFIWHGGKRYARVSNVIKRYNNFGEAPPERLENKKIIGTIVHEAIDEDLHGELPPNLLPSCVGYFNSYRKWKEINKPRIVENETRYFNDDLMITGRIDLLAILPYETVPVLIDWKTSASESPTWILQSHLYGHLIAGAGKMVANRYLFIKLCPLGSKPRVFTYDYSEKTHSFSISCVKKYWEEINNDCPKLS